MKAPVVRGPLLAAACAALACVSVVNAQPAATGPWAKAPALSTGCYLDGDPFSAQLEASLTAVQNDHSNQSDINTQIDQQVTDISNTDPMELARRMQEAMMNDPQAARQYLENTQTLGQQVQTELPEASEKAQQVEAEEKSLVARYQAALAKSHAPGDARWTALKKKMGIAPDSLGPGELGVPDWAWQEWGVILREWDAGDRATCAVWWATTGPMHAYMKSYKDYQIQERIPQHRKYIDEPKLKNYEMTSIPATGYKSTAEYEAVEKYLQLAGRLFGERVYRPRCTNDRCQ